MNLLSEKIKKDVIRVLRLQGYVIKNGLIDYPKNPTKEDLRRINELAITYKIKRAEPVLRRYENSLLRYIAEGEEIFPDRLQPKLVLVNSGTEEELLFRYASLHWSIPVSSGYGRRIRFLVIDESNGKLIGLFGIGDPVYAIKKRDDFIGWNSEIKKEKLYHVMDAYILGAVPPYSYLLGGKLVALLTLSNEVREVFYQKYYMANTIISRKTRPPWLVMLTTTSALGRSSIYNRIKLNGHEFWKGVGFTQGSGEFHFSNGIYEKIKTYAASKCEPTAKNSSWGKGFRSRREVIKKCLSDVKLSTKLLYHGIHREIFVASLAYNALEFLRGQAVRPFFYDWPVNELGNNFLHRWFLPRSKRFPEYQEFRRESYRIWPESGR